MEDNDFYQKIEELSNLRRKLFTCDIINSNTYERINTCIDELLNERENELRYLCCQFTCVVNKSRFFNLSEREKEDSVKELETLLLKIEKIAKEINWL